MSMSRDTLVELLKELDQWLDYEDSEPVEWVVCGGVAMALQNLNWRTTRDVDVLGEWDGGLLEVTYVDDFPEPVKRSIRRVIDNHPGLTGFGEAWVSLGPSRLARHGLPGGYAQRLNTMKFGEKLTLHLLSRQDLIPLKLYAASDRFGVRQSIHYQDLKMLNGSFQELESALEWMRNLPDFEEKRPEVQEVLQRLGHDDLSYSYYV